jgi:TRAP transporter 4TM/12TM fusion protein
MGAAAFLMAQMLQISYVEVCIAAAIPAFLYYLALFVQVDLEAAKRGIAGAADARVGGAARALLTGWFFPLPFALLIVAMLAYNVAAERAALLATALLALCVLLFPYKGRRLSIRELALALLSAGAALVDLVLICAAAGLVIGILNLTGLATELTLQILLISGNDIVVLLLVTAAVGLVLGMGMPTVGVYIILATLAAPALIQAGLPPLAAHLFVMYFGMMSMVTPPVALAAFAAANIARTDPWATGWTATSVAWCAFLVPFVFAFTPALLMQGATLAVLWTLASKSVAIWIGSVAAIGHFLRPVSVPGRAVIGLAAITLLLPTTTLIDAAAIAVGLSTLALDQVRTLSRQA